MKTCWVLLYCLLWTGAAHAQLTPAQQANALWGWGADTTWAKNTFLVDPTLRLTTSYVGVNGLRCLRFERLDHLLQIEAVFRAHRLFGMVYLFPPRVAYAKEWLTKQFQPTGPDAWTDKANNATIWRTRTPEGWITYHVLYQAFIK